MMKRTFILALVFCLSFSLWAQDKEKDKEDDFQKVLDRMNDLSKAFVQVARKVTPAVVHISVTKKVQGLEEGGPDLFNDDFLRRFFGERSPFPMPDRRREPELQRGLGSGVIIDPKGYILSNNHVVKDADQVIVKLGDRREFEAKIVGVDDKTDVAILKIEGSNLPTAPIGNSDDLAVGEWVLAIGNPFGLSQTVTAGIISAKGRANVGIAEYEDFIQTDAAINPGNSGGPLVNLRGEVVGINTAIASRTGGNIGIGFTIPIKMAKAVMEQIIATGKVTRGWLGVKIQEITPDLAKSFGLSRNDGAVVTEVIKDSPADRAGLQQGDVILAYEGVVIDSANHLRNMVSASRIGTKAKLTVFRHDKETELQVTIGDLSKADLSSYDNAEGGGESIDELGLELQEITPEIAKKARLRFRQGVMIANVKPGSLGDRYGLQTGDVITEINRIRIRNIQDVKQAMERNRNQILLLLQTKDGFRFISLPRRK